MNPERQSTRRHIEMRHYIAGQEVTAEAFAQRLAAEVLGTWERAVGTTLPEVEDGNRRVDCKRPRR